jgi:hypothetical protein
MAQKRRTPESLRGRPTTAPVVAVLSDAALVDEVTMVVAATGRILLQGTEDATGVRSVVLVTDADADRCRALRDELEDEGTAVRLLRVSGAPQSPDMTDDDRDREILQLPEQVADLAKTIGRDDHPTVAVHGAVGGAGASVLAIALAGVAADPLAGGCGTALLVDAVPHTGGAAGLAAVLGLDAPEIRRAGAGTVSGPLSGAELLRGLPHVGEVAVLTRAEPGTGGPRYGPVPCPVVRDAGRFPASGLSHTARGAQAEWRVLVAPATVPGALAGAVALSRDPAMHTVLRHVPGGQLSRDHAVTLLGRAPDIWWEHDGDLTGEIDTGEFSPARAGTATAAAADLWNRLTGRTRQQHNWWARWTA